MQISLSFHTYEQYLALKNNFDENHDTDDLRSFDRRNMIGGQKRFLFSLIIILQNLIVSLRAVQRLKFVSNVNITSTSYII